MDQATTWKAKLPQIAGSGRSIRTDHVFLADQLARLREGFWPRDMDDRWIVWLDGDMLRCWRSWTRTCIYETQVAEGEDGSGVVWVLDVLDDPGAYLRADTDEAELERFESVLSMVWRHRPA